MRIGRALAVEGVKILGGVGQDLLQAAFGNGHTGQFGDRLNGFQERVLGGGDEGLVERHVGLGGGDEIVDIDQPEEILSGRKIASSNRYCWK